MLLAKGKLAETQSRRRDTTFLKIKHSVQLIPCAFSRDQNTIIFLDSIRARFRFHSDPHGKTHQGVTHLSRRSGNRGTGMSRPARTWREQDRHETTYESGHLASRATSLPPRWHSTIYYLLYRYYRHTCSVHRYYELFVVHYLPASGSSSLKRSIPFSEMTQMWFMSLR